MFSRFVQSGMLLGGVVWKSNYVFNLIKLYNYDISRAIQLEQIR